MVGWQQQVCGSLENGRREQPMILDDFQRKQITLYDYWALKS